LIDLVSSEENDPRIGNSLMDPLESFSHLPIVDCVIYFGLDCYDGTYLQVLNEYNQYFPRDCIKIPIIKKIVLKLFKFSLFQEFVMLIFLI